MAELKTKATNVSVSSFIDKVSSETVRDDCYKIVEVMEDVTGYPARMWGPSIIGFGKYHYKYESGREGEMCIVGFSPRKANITLYVRSNPELMGKLGKHKAKGGCVYIKRLEDIDVKVLRKLTGDTVKDVKRKHKVIE
jgi:hypothetical protein